MAEPTDALAELWRWFAANSCAGYSPLYERLSLAVADDTELLELVLSAPPSAHLPASLLAAVHYLLLEGLDHPLAEVYAGRSGDDPVPMFRELCLSHRDEVLAILATRHIQTNDCGRSAVIAPGLTWFSAAFDAPFALVDVGTSAGLNLLCDRYLLDYGEYGTTGPVDSPVRVACRVAGGHPPIAATLAPFADRIGIDRSPVDLSDPGDARWLLACVWPDTGRLERTAASIEVARGQLPRMVAGDANSTLPEVLAGLGPGTPAVVLTTWSFAYFSKDQRRRFLELLDGASRQRPLGWLSADGAGVVDLLAGVSEEDGHRGSNVLGAVLFDHGAHAGTLLATVQQHGAWLDWST